MNIIYFLSWTCSDLFLSSILTVFVYDKYYDWSLTNLSLKIVLNYFFSNWQLFPINCIGGVIASVLASSVVDHGFKPRLGQTKHYKIGICCFSANHAALRRKNKDWLARNLDNVSEWGDMSICGRLFQWARHYKNPAKHVGLVQSGPHPHHFIEN